MGIRVVERYRILVLQNCDSLSHLVNFPNDKF